MAKKQNSREKIELLINSNIKENSHLFWNSFQHMFDVRERIAQNKINFLLLVSTFLPILSITLYTTKFSGNNIILFPMFFQFIAIFILLKNFFQGGNTLHWFEFEPTLDSIKEGIFEKDFFCNMKAFENASNKQMIFSYRKIIVPALYFVIFSLFSFILAIVFILFKLCLLNYIIVLIICATFFILIKEFYKPFEIKTDGEIKKLKQKFDEWIEKEAKKDESKK